ncbi:hypothetical protein L6164_031582 [Bauhinia variegata]|uniref:Uncharacterized protein n=1 Tax=Bauhinia variegata TaxID=167791 RepID=A0ACB9LHE4_BAUVA|nr:hypothetical protein L6164_031582 [Bauhinia variegata]
MTLVKLSGIPLRHRFPMWFLSFSMSASLTSLAITYIFRTQVVNGNTLIPFVSPEVLFILIWIGLLWLISLYNTIRFLDWLVKRCRKGRKKKRNTAANP